MDCREYKELLDSYFCEELAIETNHAMLRHAEACGACRTEMSARRQLRQSMRRACLQEGLSEDARRRLHECLRTEALGCRQKGIGTRRRVLAAFFPLTPTFAFATLAVIFLGSVGVAVYLLRDGRGSETVGLPAVSNLKDALFELAAGDHRQCVEEYQRRLALAGGASLGRFDPAYSDLESFAHSAAAAGGLDLCSKHVCIFKERRFAHLMYGGKKELVSLMVTDRDAGALGLSAPPVDDGANAGCQNAVKEQLALSGYQSRKHIVFLVSALPPGENLTLAKELAAPVAADLRRTEEGNFNRISGRMTIPITEKINRRMGLQTSRAMNK